jgi:ribonucleoside-triphosphate reductase (thioredoxin)
LKAVDLLAHVKLTQENWVAAGRRPERCTAPWLRHNVSNTITVRDDEWDDVTRYIYEHRSAFAGVSLLSEGGDMDYPQAPFCSVWTNDEINDEYGVGALFASGLIVDGNHAFNNDLWAACDCVLGRGTGLDVPPAPTKASIGDMKKYEEEIKRVILRKDWVRRAHKFAANYFGGDLKRMTHCLKRVNNCKLWEDLQREYTPVDYTLMHEDSDMTKLLDAQACAGGKCEVT